MGANVSCTGEMRNAYKILVRRSEGKRPLVRPRRRYRMEDNITMDLKEIICGLDSSGSG
jgi:hypothetical protein